MDALTACAGGAAPEAAPAWAEAARRDFAEALGDDLNVPEGLAALFALVREANGALARGELAPGAAAGVLRVFDELDAVLGVVRFGRTAAEGALPPEVAALAEARAAARAARDWAGADRLRGELAALGWEARDTKEGQKVRKL